MLESENLRLAAENSLLKEQTNGIFNELNNTVKDLTTEVSKMLMVPPNSSNNVECNVKEEYSIIDMDPFQYNPNAFFMIVMFLVLVLPSVFFPI